VTEYSDARITQVAGGRVMEHLSPGHKGDSLLLFTIAMLSGAGCRLPAMGNDAEGELAC
jgi:hypothetical protein